ncbi:hypothetical protein H4Q26_012121 [Puccinia striiformis f. sp. tritici PST-130]|nr:hypothetical protein H4Q26_012121 [Puccinia striiformis f. sp. tritici PST-130]
MTTTQLVRVDGRVRNAYLLDSDAFVRGHDVSRLALDHNYYDPKTLANGQLTRWTPSALAGDGPDSLDFEHSARGSAAWHGMGSSSTTPEEKVHLGTQLTQVISSAMLVGDRVKKSAERSIHLFRTLVCVMVFLFGVTFLSFIFVFSMLIYQFTRKHNSLGRKAFTSNPFRRWTKSKITASNIEELSNGANQTRSSVNSVSCLLIPSPDRLIHHWRLYQDELGGTLPNGTYFCDAKNYQGDGVEPKPKPSGIRIGHIDNHYSPLLRKSLGIIVYELVG